MKITWRITMGNATIRGWRTGLSGRSQASWPTTEVSAVVRGSAECSTITTEQLR